MTNPFEDERLQFFLRHREDIREWASIEKAVTQATRELLAGAQMELEERLPSGDSATTTSRLDGGAYERILVSHVAWPSGVGLALEWGNGVDPFGSSLPKFGVFFLNRAPELERAHRLLVGLCANTPFFSANGFKVPGDSVWPTVKFVAKSRDWWEHPDVWRGGIVDWLVQVWPLAAPLIDEGLGA